MVFDIEEIAKRKSLDVIKTYLKKGFVSVDAKDDDDKNFMDYITEYDRFDVINFLNSTEGHMYLYPVPKKINLSNLGGQ